MRNYTHIFFDFDGTLFDTSEGVYKSFDYVADFYGIKIEDKSVYSTMIGPPLLESFSRVFGFSGDKLTEAMAKYREYYTARGMYECRLYDGLTKLIQAYNNPVHNLDLMQVPRYNVQSLLDIFLDCKEPSLH